MQENRLFEDYCEILSMKIEYRMSNKKFRMSKYGLASLCLFVYPFNFRNVYRSQAQIFTRCKLQNVG